MKRTNLAALCLVACLASTRAAAQSVRTSDSRDSTIQAALEVVRNRPWDTDDLRAAAHAMNTKGTSSVDSLVAMLAEDDRRRRQRAIFVLGAMGPKAASAAPALTALLSSSESGTSSAAARALGRMPGTIDTTVVPALKRALTTDQDSDPWNWTVPALAALACRDVGAVTRLLDDPTSSIRMAGASALGWLGWQAHPALPALESLHERTSGVERVFMSSAILDIRNDSAVYGAYHGPVLLTDARSTVRAPHRPVVKGGDAADFRRERWEMTGDVVGQWTGRLATNQLAEVAVTLSMLPDGRFSARMIRGRDPALREQGTWRVDVGYNGDDNPDARSWLLCFASPRGGIFNGECGSRAMRRSSDYSDEVVWAPVGSARPLFTLTRTPSHAFIAEFSRRSYCQQ